ncbi:MAG TPA: DUF6057 family protein [Bacteroidales bacterium]|nr:DUF6057 family protein [Bacteroidales bacterium]
MRGKTRIFHLPVINYLLLFIFLLTAGFFLLASDYVLSFQKEQYLFIFSIEQLKSFFLVPGGILELAGKFLTQFYSIKIPGALLLGAVLTTPGIIMVSINRILGFNTKTSIILPVVASCLLFLMQTHYYHLMEYNLGYISILLLFYISVKLVLSGNHWFILVVFPFFCYIAGGTYSLIFLAMYLIFLMVYDRGIQRFIFYSLIIIVTTVTFLVFRDVLFLLPPQKLLLNAAPVVNDQFHRAVFFILTAFLVIYPLLTRAISAPQIIKKIDTKLFSSVVALIIIALTAFIAFRFYNKQTRRVVTIQDLAYEGKWNELIDYQEKYPSVNLVGQYFYNVALTETGQLCNRLFEGRQDFHETSLMLPWKDDYLSWGGYSFYSAGLINEAHRWAYEEMVVYTMRPHNIMMLAKTNLINRNTAMAEKYLGLLKRTIFYRKWAQRYEAYATDTTKISADTELNAKTALIPQKNFFVYLESPEANLPKLFEANKRNSVAFEYMMAYMMLTKNVEALANNVHFMNSLGYKSIPRHIEEAILIWYNAKKEYPDLGGLSVSAATQNRFNAYFNAYLKARNNPSTMKEALRPFANTFWYYYHFN